MKENAYRSPDSATPAERAGRADFHYTQKGRGLYSLLFTAFVAFLAAAFLIIAVASVVSRSPVILIAGPVALFLLFLTVSGLYAFFKGEQWSFHIRDGLLEWSYPRWPKSRGSIALRGVRKVVVNDGVHTLFLTLEDGTTRTIKFFGVGAYLRDYLKESFPHLAVEFLEGSS